MCCLKTKKWEALSLIYFISVVHLLLGNGEAATIQNSISTANGFLPSPVKYFSQGQQEGGGDTEKSQVDAQEAGSSAHAPYDLNATSTSSRAQEARFGYPLSGDGSYGMSGVYAPTRIDLGGVLLGAIVGFGAILILPKLLHLLTVPVGSSPHPYGRNVEEVTTGLNSVLNRVDAALERENIDSSACIQRAICESVKASPSDGFINTLARNSLVSSLVKGSTVEGAVESARGFEGCSQFAAKCPFNQRIIANSLKNLLT